MSAPQIGLLSDAALQTNRTKTTCGSEIFSYLRPPHADTPPSEERPLLVLLHGYPQTSYIWRHLLRLLPPSYPLFIPDLPGYGRSTPSLTTHDKLTIGLAILEALHTILPNNPYPSPIILIGHDRGARIAHRLALTFSHPPPSSITTKPLPPFTLAALAVLDTVPEPEQWSAFASPPAAASSFHWPFLANAELATAMIEAFGARRWCGMLLERWSGDSNIEGDDADADAAAEAYCAAFEAPGVFSASTQLYNH
ncbi:putative alpha beta hydrolase [Diplodia seriata]|uniref:Putative alpha beta hydrolase n=1 Tax=Diplodia seriata TaxID=420778 RepID=A0A0G2G444_9PEZI|nr:putative alpha beta hydrolase [Diplodia seriata]